jgi:hypothetical protein
MCSTRTFVGWALLLGLVPVGAMLQPAHSRGDATSAEPPASRPGRADGSPAASKPAASKAKAAPQNAQELSPQLLALRDRLRGVLAHHEKRKLDASQHSAWEVMHWVIAYGVKAEVLVGGAKGAEEQNAIGWLCFNRTFQGDRILTVENGRPIGVIGVGLQGHHGQLLAILAQSYLSRDYPMHVNGQSFKVEDLLENEKLTCRTGMELTFKLIAAAHYLTTDTTWKNEAGQDWSIARLVREEIRAPIQGAACGGTHRLMGLSYAVRKRQKEKRPMDGEFARAQEYLRDYHRYTFRLQNPDGSFSTQWLEFREARPDLDRRLQTSGHILEWLAYSLDEEELRRSEMVRAVEYLTDLLARRRDRKWEIGPLGHALHGLALYDQRVFREETKATIEVRREPPPRRAPQSTDLNKEWQGERSILRQWILHHALRSVTPSPRLPLPASESSPRIIPPANGSGGDNEQTPQVASDAGPLLLPAKGWLK